MEMKIKLSLLIFMLLSIGLFSQNENVVLRKKSNISPEASISVLNQIPSPSNFSGNNAVILSEGFDGSWLPSGWTQSGINSANTWIPSNPLEHNFSEIDPSNVFSALVPWVAQNQNEWLYSPLINTSAMTSMELKFYAGVSGGWLSSATLMCMVTTNNGGSWKILWNAVDEISPDALWGWNLVTLDISSYASSEFKLAWKYIGNDGDLAGIDGVLLVGESGGSGVNASFSASQTSLTVGQSVQYTNTSTGSNSWNWVFEGGTPSTSTLQNPSVTYNSIGVYDVSLTAKNGSDQDVETKNNFITVSPQSGGELSVEVDIDPGTTICEFGDVNLIAIASGGTGSYQYTWTWDVNNQEVSGNSLNVTNLSQNANIYLKVISGTEQIDKTISLTIKDSPPASIVAKGNPERILICPHPELEYQWYQNNLILPEMINQFLYPGESTALFGVYYVKTTNETGCVSYSENYTASDLKSGSPMSLSNILTVFPNPSNGAFSIDLNPELLLSELDSYHIELISATGHKVWETNFSPDFSTSFKPEVELPVGLYIIKLYGDNQLFDTQKLLIN